MRAQTERLRMEYRDSMTRARELVASRPGSSLQVRPADGEWCAVECIEHLNLTNDDYLRRVRTAMDQEPVRPPRKEERLSLLGRLLVRAYEPPVRRRFTAAGTLVPPAGHIRADLVLARFEQSHLAMIRLLEESDAIDRMRMKVPFSDSDWIRLPLFDTLCFLSVHDRRHLWQAERAARV